MSVGVKDRRHYGVLVREEVVAVTPEQAGEWLTTPPPPPVMWSRGSSLNEKSRRFAALMEAGEWEVERAVEPVMISEDHGYVLGGHHRLTAVTLLDRPQRLRVRFYQRPDGWENYGQQRMRIEAETGKPWDGREES